ncbi:hypothetical protein N9Q55_02660 [Flavobacteriaceae bacterium]|nr:hypothetical protein [Flavobacteriaceae bacterium]MDA9929375.1 hypothetical protein [Flavobacteriaceae bacterium]MDC6457441.1 hypothetical protein [Flavobacteriaceae bacterium]
MKKLLLLLFAIVFSSSLFAQEYYWTTYSFDVEAEDEEIVTKLFNDYFSAANSKAEGVSTFLFENHFIDSANHASHTVAFTGTLDAMGKQYSRGENISWELFTTKLSRYITHHSAASGRSLISYGIPGSHSIQNLYILKVKNAAKFASAWEEYNSKFSPKDRRVTLGRFSLGRSSDGETHYVLSGVDSFEDAFNPGKYRESNSSAKNAWSKFVEEFEENAQMIRTQTRVMIGKW